MTADLLTRLGTAAVLVPAVLAAIHVDPTHWSVLGLACAVVAFGHDEYLRMALPATDEEPMTLLRAVGGGLGIILVICASTYSLAAVGPLLTLAVVVLGVAALARRDLVMQAGRHLGVTLSGLLYVPLLVSLLPLLKQSGHGPWLTVVLCMTFFSDTGAYLAGRAYGRTKLYPEVSPGKTWEGALGGIAGSCAAIFVIGRMWLTPEVPWTHAVVLGVVCSICGQAGDLVESLLKRSFGVKDSGNLLPGHGGMLDRVDGMIFVAPVAYLYVTYIVPTVT